MLVNVVRLVFEVELSVPFEFRNAEGISKESIADLELVSLLYVAMIDLDKVLKLFVHIADVLRHFEISGL